MGGLEIGSTVRGVVSEVHVYGVELQCSEERIVVFLPEIAWEPGVDPMTRFATGDRVEVKILRLTDEENPHYVGSLRALDVEGNPYTRLAAQLGEVVSCQVKTVADGVATLVLPHSIWHHVETYQFPLPLQSGTSVDVRIVEVDVGTRRVRLEPAAG